MFTDYKDGANGWKYQTTKEVIIQTSVYPKNAIMTEYIQLSLLGTLTVKEGYHYDGAIGAIDTDTIMLGSLGHDALYQLIELGILGKEFRKSSDKTLYNICRSEGMSWFRASYVYRTVRLVGWYFVK